MSDEPDELSDFVGDFLCEEEDITPINFSNICKECPYGKQTYQVSDMHILQEYKSV